MKGRSKAYILGIIAVLIWSTVASAFKITLRSMEPLSMVLLASVTSCLVLLLILIKRGKLKKLSYLSRNDVIISLILGAINPFLYYIVLFSTYDILKAQEAQALNYSWPIMLTLMSIIILRQKSSKLQIGAVLIAFLGMVVITSRGSFFFRMTIEPLGILLGIFSAFIWATYWIFNLKSRIDDDIRLFLNFISGSVLIMVLVLLRGGITDWNGLGVFGSVYIGLFEMGITFIIWLGALRLSGEASKISNLIYLSPFISLLFIRMVVGEPILITTIIGLMMIALGVAVQRYDDHLRKDRHSLDLHS